MSGKIFSYPSRTRRRIIISMQVLLWWDSLSAEFLVDRQQKNPFPLWKSSLTSKSFGGERGFFRFLPGREYIDFENPLKDTSNPLGICTSACVLPVSLKPNSHSFAFCMLWDARYLSLERKDENITRKLILYRTENLQRFGSMPKLCRETVCA